MAAERLSMRKIIGVLRLTAAGHSDRAIARSAGISHGTVREHRRRAEAARVGWPLPGEWTASELEARLFPAPAPSNVARRLSDWARVHEEMKARRRTGLTLQLLWAEYKEAWPDGLQYGLDLVLRHAHRAGLVLFGTPQLALSSHI